MKTLADGIVGPYSMVTHVLEIGKGKGEATFEGSGGGRVKISGDNYEFIHRDQSVRSRNGRR